MVCTLKAFTWQVYEVWTVVLVLPATAFHSSQSEQHIVKYLWPELMKFNMIPAAFCRIFEVVSAPKYQDTQSIPLRRLRSTIAAVEKQLISRPIRRTFFPRKSHLNSTCFLCAEDKYYFQTFKYPYIYYTTSLSWDSENSHEDDFSGSDDDFLGFYDE